LDGIITAATVGQAIEAYDTGRYRDALNFYEDAAQSPTGDQLRVYNGIYLSGVKPGASDLSQKFVRLADSGFRKNRLALKVLFSPGSAPFAPDSEFASQYVSCSSRLHQRVAQGAAVSMSSATHAPLDRRRLTSACRSCGQSRSRNGSMRPRHRSAGICVWVPVRAT
jgi:hypothetical protein